jgi:hypothetical protein
LLCLIVKNKNKNLAKGKTMNTTMNKVVGMVPNNSMANKTGLDDIDKWAASVGDHQRRIRIMAIQKKGKKQV